MLPSVPTPAPPRQPDRLDATPGGVASYCVAVVALGFGLVLSNTAALLLGYALLLLKIVNLVLAARQNWRLKGSRRVVGPLVAGCPFTVEVTLTSPEGHRHGLDLTNWASETCLFWAIPALAEKETFHGTAQLVLKWRGRRRLGALLAGSTHPFGLLRLTRVVAPPEEILVLPALGRLRRDHLRRLIGGPEASRPTRGRLVSLFVQDEIRGLRDYRPGDAKRSIHWRTSARVGRLMVREFDEPPGEGLLVVLDPTLKDNSKKAWQAFEAIVSLAATLCWEAARECPWLGLLVATATPVLLAKTPDREHVQLLLETLAVVAPGPRADEPALRAALSDLPRAAVLLVASGPSPLEAALRGNRRSVRHLDPADPDVRSFYEPPQPHAAEWQR